MKYNDYRDGKYTSIEIGGFCIIQPQHDNGTGSPTLREIIIEDNCSHGKIAEFQDEFDAIEYIYRKMKEGRDKANART
jgi:hypothetical protein